MLKYGFLRTLMNSSTWDVEAAFSRTPKEIEREVSRSSTGLMYLLDMVERDGDVAVI